MTFTIGHFGASPALSSVQAWNTSGNTISVTGRYAGTVANALALRDQFAGLINNPDEPCLPVQWDADRTVDGYYQVTDASWNMVGPSLANGLFEFSCTLVKLASVYACQVEAVVTAALLPNDLSVTGPEPWWASPLPSVDLSNPPWPAAYSVIDDRTTATGDVRYRQWGGTGYELGTGSYWVAPGDYYKGACVLSCGGVPVIGRTAPPLQGFAVASWQISNGLVRVTGTATTDVAFTVETYNGSWSTPIAYRVQDHNNPADWGMFLGTPTVLRNSPECVSIRFLTGNCINDLTIRRGGWWVLGNAAIPPNGADNGITFKVQTDSTVTGTTTTGGVRWTTGSDYRLLFSAVDSTVSTAGSLTATTNTVNSYDYGIGYVPAGASATTYQTLAKAKAAYFTAVAVEERVVPL